MSAAGVPGIGGNGWIKPVAGSPEEAPDSSSLSSGTVRLISGDRGMDERRRR